MFRTLPVFLFAVGVLAANANAEDGIKTAPSKIATVTIYQNAALVTREVTLPEAAGQMEVVVSPLPSATMQSSLYAEGSEAVRVLSARYRTRAIAEDNREEVRKLETEIKALQRTLVELEADMKGVALNMGFNAKLEAFTAATMSTLTEKGLLDSDKTILLANHIRDSRAKLIKDEVKLKQTIETDQQRIAFLTRQLQEKSGGVSRTERDAVIVVDKKAGVSTIKLNYLVSSATWKPQYKLRAATKANDPVTVEYLASVTQQTGEDWPAINLVLSTAQPLLNAAPPDLKSLEVSVGVPGQPGLAIHASETKGEFKPSGKALEDLDNRSKSLRQQSQFNYDTKNPQFAAQQQNDAAALEQFRDLLVTKDDMAKSGGLNDNLLGDGPSVTYRLKTKLTLPSRSDDQTLEIAKLDLAPKFYYKAVPLLTTHVYRLADLTNSTDMILLPGESSMYLDSDFVGTTKMPFVAVGKPFTVGFGVDPQLQVIRKLMDKTRTTQGGNQLLTFKYKILLSSYKTTPVDVQVWDRMPHAEAMQTIGTTFIMGATKLSEEPLYVRDEKPKNLLRWDVKVEPKQNGEKALAIDYDYKMELDKTVTIGSFLSK